MKVSGLCLKEHCDFEGLHSGVWDVPCALWWSFRCLPGAPAWSLGPAQLCILLQTLKTCSSPPRSSGEANDMELLLEDPTCHGTIPKDKIPFLYISNWSGRKPEIVPLGPIWFNTYCLHRAAVLCIFPSTRTTENLFSLLLVECFHSDYSA